MVNRTPTASDQGFFFVLRAYESRFIMLVNIFASIFLLPNLLCLTVHFPMENFDISCQLIGFARIVGAVRPRRRNELADWFAAGWWLVGGGQAPSARKGARRGWVDAAAEGFPR